jgi:hypothetical protein
MASPPSVGSTTTAIVPARCPPDRFRDAAGAADVSSFDPDAFDSLGGGEVAAAGFDVAVPAGAEVGAARDDGRVVEVAGAGAVVVDADGSPTPAAALVGAGAPAVTTTVPFIQGCGAQW